MHLLSTSGSMQGTDNIMKKNFISRPPLSCFKVLSSLLLPVFYESQKHFKPGARVSQMPQRVLGLGPMRSSWDIDLKSKFFSADQGDIFFQDHLSFQDGADSY